MILGPQDPKQKFKEKKFYGATKLQLSTAVLSCLAYLQQL